MAKTNFTKVEEALAEGMRKIEVDKLLQKADENSGKVKESTEEKVKVSTIHLQRLKKVDQDLKSLEKHGKKPYARLKINPEEVKRFLKDPSLLTAQDWERVKTIKEQIIAFQAELEKKTENADDKIVSNEIKNQKTKRFNINDKWIPLR